jgi:hypothetical protein
MADARRDVAGHSEGRKKAAWRTGKIQHRQNAKQPCVSDCQKHSFRKATPPCFRKNQSGQKSGGVKNPAKQNTMRHSQSPGGISSGALSFIGSWFCFINILESLFDHLAADGAVLP